MTIAARPSLRRRAEIGRPLFAAASAILAVMLCPASVLSPNKIQRYRIARASGAHDANSASVHLTEKRWALRPMSHRRYQREYGQGLGTCRCSQLVCWKCQVFCPNNCSLCQRLCFSEQSFQTMKLKRAIAAIVLLSAFAAPASAGTFEDAVEAYARGDHAKALRLIRPRPMMATLRPNSISRSCI